MPDIDLTPGKSRFKEAWSGLWRGFVAGNISGLGMAFAGAPVGGTAGGLVASAVFGGAEGKIIAVHHGIEIGQILWLTITGQEEEA